MTFQKGLHTDGYSLIPVTAYKVSCASGPVQVCMAAEQALLGEERAAVPLGK